MDRSGARGGPIGGRLPARIGRLTAAFGVAAAALALTLPTPAHADYRTADQILVNHFVSLEAGLLHITPVSPVTVVEVTHRIYTAEYGKKEPAYTYTDPFDASGHQSGPVKSCTITVGSDAHQPGVDPAKPPGPGNAPSKNLGFINEELKTFLSHEVFHCLSAKLAGTIDSFDKHGAWLIEGAAAWVSSDLVDHSAIARDDWLEYLESPTRSLFKREDDAIGFFGHLAKSGISPWKVFAKMFAAPNDTAAYAAAVGTNLTFPESEASAFFDKEEYGTAWVARGQSSATADGNVPPLSTKLPTRGPPAHRTETLMVAPYADAPDELTVAAPYTQVAVLSGTIRVHSLAGGAEDLVSPGAVTLCKRGASKCNCPGTHVDFPSGYLAISGGPGGAQVKLIGLNDCPAIPPHSCSGLLSIHDFPGATGERAGGEAPFSGCAFTVPEPDGPPPPPPPPDGAGSLDVVTLGNAAMARQYWVDVIRQCQGCGPIGGVGDQAEMGHPRYEEDIGYFYDTSSGYARVDNVIIEVGVVPRDDALDVRLMRQVVAELLATEK